MEIILLEKIQNLGHLGDVVSVKDGYARNFLIPSGKAQRATKENKAVFEERRKELVKQVKSETELCKVSIRNSRREANDELKKLNKSGLSDDELRSAEEKVQLFTDEQIKKVDAIFLTKEKDILTF